MTPYYGDAGQTIYHGDCREILPQLTADVVLTDLPYGVGLDYGPSYDDTPEALDALISSTLPLMLNAAPVVALTCGVVNVWRYPPPRWILCWYQSNAAASTGYWGFNQWQPILVYGTDPYLRNGLGRRPDVVVTSAPNSGNPYAHPCPKPTQSWAKIMHRVSPLMSDVILDPFMGSGATLDAAKYAGRRAIGIEVNEAYCEIAANRLAQGVLDFGGVA